MFMCSESWLSARSTNDTRGRVFAFYQITVYLFQGLAQFLLNLPDETGFALFALFSVLMSLAIVPVALTRVPAPELPENTSFNIVKLWKTSPTGMTAALVTGLILGAFHNVGPRFAQLAGLDRAMLSAFMSVTIIGGLVLRWARPASGDARRGRGSCSGQFHANGPGYASRERALGLGRVGIYALSALCRLHK